MASGFVIFGELDIAVSVDWHQNLDYRASLEGWEETMNMDNFSRNFLKPQKRVMTRYLEGNNGILN